MTAVIFTAAGVVFFLAGCVFYGTARRVRRLQRSLERSYREAGSPPGDGAERLRRSSP